MKQEIKTAIANALLMYNRQVNEVIILAYENFLSDLDPRVVLLEISIWVKSEKFMFTPADIRNKIIPEPTAKDLAREITMRINQAVSKIGWSSPNEAKEFIGEVGWVAVERWGGWNYVCENLGVTLDVNNFIAQTRDAIESRLKHESTKNWPALSGGTQKQLVGGE